MTMAQVGWVSDFPLLLSTNRGVEQSTRRNEPLLRAMSRSYTFGVVADELRSLLDEAVNEARTVGWDGYDGNPASDASAEIAARFAEAMLAVAPLPSIEIDPDGNVLLEWMTAPNRRFAVSVSGRGRLSYAGLYGDNSVHGSEYFSDQVPHEILAGVHRALS